MADQLKFYDVWGSAKTYPHMSIGWAWAFDTPFSWTRQIASHFGGTRQGRPKLSAEDEQELKAAMLKHASDP